MRVAEFDENQMQDTIRELQQRDPQFHDSKFKVTYLLGVPVSERIQGIKSPKMNKSLGGSFQSRINLKA